MKSVENIQQTKLVLKAEPDDPDAMVRWARGMTGTEATRLDENKIKEIIAGLVQNRYFLAGQASPEMLGSIFIEEGWVAVDGHRVGFVIIAERADKAMEAVHAIVEGS
jgi:hypothetical protein